MFWERRIHSHESKQEMVFSFFVEGRNAPAAGHYLSLLPGGSGIRHFKHPVHLGELFPLSLFGCLTG
jgi:hypothetical protein